MKRKQSDGSEINADAFLDTVANLVGILVILVVVVASQTKIAAKAAVEKELKEHQDELLDERLETASAVEASIGKQVSHLQQHEIAIYAKKLERDALMMKLVSKKQELEQEKEELSQDEQEKIEATIELTELQEKIAALLEQQGDLESQSERPEAITLQHLPTPMAKTVFGKEIHVLLQQNRMSVIPWDQLVESLRDHAQMAASRSSTSNRVVDTLGPIDGFVMKYALTSSRGVIARGGAYSAAQRVELDYFVLEPTMDASLETLEESMGLGGRLRGALALHSPRETTITVWVYPDSFATFRELKERLFVEGYLTAARPLPNGIRVGASPRGSASTSQ